MDGDDSRSRRRVLGAIGAGLTATVAGCGYQPAAGDLDWQTDAVDRPGLFFAKQWRSDGEYLYGVRDDSWVAAYDRTGDVVWSGAPDENRDGDFAVADGRVYLRTEDALIALERDPDSESDDDSVGMRSQERYGAAARTRWTSALDLDHTEGGDADTDSDDDDGGDADNGDADEDDTILLAADSELVVGFRDGLVAFDSADGDERFRLGHEDVDGRRLDAVAIGDDAVWAIAGMPAERDERAARRGGRDTATDADDDPDPTLYTIAADGELRAIRSLPDAPDWFRSVGSVAVLGVEGELWVLDADGDRWGTLELAGDVDSAVAVVADRDRCYHYARTTLEAIDIETVERVWQRDVDRFYHPPVADADGVYAVTGDPTTIDGCRLTAFAPDGDQRWDIRPPTNMGCGDECVLVDDRLVVRNGDQLYGFRTDRGRRRSVLG